MTFTILLLHWYFLSFWRLQKDETEATTANENGDNKDDEKESIRHEVETIKEPASGNNELKVETPAAMEKVAEEKVEEKMEISTWGLRKVSMIHEPGEKLSYMVVALLNQSIENRLCYGVMILWFISILMI